MMMEAESTSETSVSFYQTARHNIPEDKHLQKRKWQFLCYKFGLVGGVWAVKLDGSYRCYWLSSRHWLLAWFIYRQTVFIIGFEVLTAVSMKIAVFWVVAPCSTSLHGATTKKTAIFVFIIVSLPLWSDVRTIYAWRHTPRTLPTYNIGLPICICW
jgi:hypothetical protein